MTTTNTPAGEELELLPCPLCGSTDLFLRDIAGWELDCRNCELSLVLADDPSREGLIACWNSRAAVAAPRGDGSLTPEQVKRAALTAESRGIDEETAQELVYLRDFHAAASSSAAPSLIAEQESLARLLIAGRRWREARTAYMSDNAMTSREYGLAGDELAGAITAFDNVTATPPTATAAERSSSEGQVNAAAVAISEYLQAPPSTIGTIERLIARHCFGSNEQLHDEMERGAMIETIKALEIDRDELRQVARMALQQFEFTYKQRQRGWDAKFLMERLRTAITDSEGTGEFSATPISDAARKAATELELQNWLLSDITQDERNQVTAIISKHIGAATSGAREAAFKEAIAVIVGLPTEHYIYSGPSRMEASTFRDNAVKALEAALVVGRSKVPSAAPVEEQKRIPSDFITTTGELKDWNEK